MTRQEGTCYLHTVALVGLAVCVISDGEKEGGREREREGERRGREGEREEGERERRGRGRERGRGGEKEREREGEGGERLERKGRGYEVVGKGE